MPVGQFGDVSMSDAIRYAMQAKTAPRPLNRLREHPAPKPSMVWIPGGVFLMGSDRHYQEEGPAHHVRVDPFWMDRHLVTNAQFRKFVEETGHVTIAETARPPRDRPTGAPDALVPRSLVFVKPQQGVDLHDSGKWWIDMPGADWRHPRGPQSAIDDLDDHPVVHVAYPDAQAYAAWAGKVLPTEAEWELAARGGLEGAEFPWGNDPTPGRYMANYWQGEFPWQNLASDGYEGTSPVRAFPANGYGLYDMVGNTWEWTSDWYQGRHPEEKYKPGCIPLNPRGGKVRDSFDPQQPKIRIPRKVLKGGSYLCADNYCYRYRPPARLPQPIDTSACHIGFRCIIRTN
jgi:formylglycine-generating enzyme